MSLEFAPSSPELKRTAAGSAFSPYAKTGAADKPLLVQFTGSMFMFKKECVPPATSYALTRTVGDVLSALLKHNPAMFGKGSAGAMVHRGGKSTFVVMGTSALSCSTTLAEALKIIPRVQWKNIEVLSEERTKRESDQLQVCVGMWKKGLQWPLWTQGVDRCPLSRDMLGEPGCGLRDLVLLSSDGVKTTPVSRGHLILAVAELATSTAAEPRMPVTNQPLTADQVLSLIEACGTLDHHVLPMLQLPACTVGLTYSKLFGVSTVQSTP